MGCLNCLFHYFMRKLQFQARLCRWRKAQQRGNLTANPRSAFGYQAGMHTHIYIYIYIYNMNESCRAMLIYDIDAFSKMLFVVLVLCGVDEDLTSLLDHDPWREAVSTCSRFLRMQMDSI